MLIGFASLFLLLRGQLRETETLARTRSLYNADASTIMAMAESELVKKEGLTWQAIERVSRTNDRVSPAKQRNALMNAELLRAYLGKPRIAELVSRLEDAGPQDLISFHGAFHAIRELKKTDLDQQLFDQLNQLIAKQVMTGQLPDGSKLEDGTGNKEYVQRIQMRARLTWIMMLAGQGKLLPANWFDPSRKADPRTMLTIALADWFMDQPAYRSVFQQTGMESHRLAVLCQSIYFLPASKRSPESDLELAKALLGKLNHPRISVRSSARAALTHLGQLSLVNSTRGFQLAQSGQDWFSVSYDTTADWNHLDFARISDEKESAFWLATTETPWEILRDSLSDSGKKRRNLNIIKIRGLIAWRFMAAAVGSRRNASQVDVQAFLEGVEEPNAPATVVEFVDAVSCCSWLCKHISGLDSSYQFTDRASGTVKNIQYLDGHGFRLPTHSECSKASKGQSNDTFGFGSVNSNMRHFGWTLEYSDKRSHPIAHKLPNAQGLFDCYGNAHEWCWPTENGKLKSRFDPSNQDNIKAGGGSYLDLRYETVQSGQPPTDSQADERNWSMGFRIAITQRPKGTMSQD